MRIPVRVERANTGLLLAGLGCLAAAIAGAGLSIGEVSTKGLSTPGAIVLGVVGCALIAASFFVGVDVSGQKPPAAAPPESPSSPGPDAPAQRADDRVQLRQAAAALTSALRQPDAMRWNVKQAKRLVETAFATAGGVAELQPLARSLLDASHDEDLSAATSVLNRLTAPQR